MLFIDSQFALCANWQNGLVPINKMHVTGCILCCTRTAKIRYFAYIVASALESKFDIAFACHFYSGINFPIQWMTRWSDHRTTCIVSRILIAKVPNITLTAAHCGKNPNEVLQLF